MPKTKPWAVVYRVDAREHPAFGQWRFLRDDFGGLPLDVYHKNAQRVCATILANTESRIITYRRALRIWIADGYSAGGPSLQRAMNKNTRKEKR